MDSFDAKKDNRKKFQDKQKLKHRHGTPSDRKYYNLNKAEELKEKAKEREEKLEKKLGNNLERYNDETVAIEGMVDDFDSTLVTAKIKEILQNRPDEDIQSVVKDKSELKSKDIHSMGLNELNNLLGKAHTVKEPANPIEKTTEQEDSNTKTDVLSPQPTNKINDTTQIPDVLIDDQDFLDSII